MAKYTGRGGKFFIGTGAVPTYAEVAQVSSIGSVAITADETEVTTLDNQDGFKEFLQTFKDSGELPITLVWDPALPTHGDTADGLWGLFVSGETRPFQIEFPTLPTAYVASFDGFVKTFPTPALTPADALTAEVSIRVSGTVDLAVKGALTSMSREGGDGNAPLTPEEQRRANEAYRRQNPSRRPTATPTAQIETLDEALVTA
jgi:Lambda phage tail tube protein, TTP